MSGFFGSPTDTPSWPVQPPAENALGGYVEQLRQIGNVTRDAQVQPIWPQANPVGTETWAPSLTAAGPIDPVVAVGPNGPVTASQAHQHMQNALHVASLAMGMLGTGPEEEAASGALRGMSGSAAAPQTWYHGTMAEFEGSPQPRSGFTWWTPSREWAENYGTNIHERAAGDARLLTIKGDSAAAAYRTLKRAGVDLKGLRAPFEGDEEFPPEEVHQYLANTPGLAQRIRAAGYDGVRHPDIREGEGRGTAIAIAAP